MKQLHQNMSDDVSREAGAHRGGPDRLMQGHLTRRKVLGGLLLATAGTAVVSAGGRLQVAGAATGTKSRSPNMAASAITYRSGHPLVFGPLIASDGFPRASIQGTFVGFSSPYCMVNAAISGSSSVVPVTVVPNTQVLAGGVLSYGTLGQLSVGDRVFVFTSVDSGERVAFKIEQNPRFYRLVVSAITAARISGITVPSDPTPGVAVQFATNSLTRFPQLSVPAVGSMIQVATISNAPSNASEIVAIGISMLSAS